MRAPWNGTFVPLSITQLWNSEMGSQNFFKQRSKSPLTDQGFLYNMS